MSVAHSQDKYDSKYKSDVDEDWLNEYPSSVPVYSGFDTNTTEEEYCWNCCRRPKKLLRCGRCQLVWYCDRECQKEHFSDHKSECKSVYKSTKVVEACREELEHMQPVIGGEPENAFETLVGNFWQVEATRGYMQARALLLDDISFIANKIETKSSLESALKHQLDMLRLCPSDNIGVHVGIPKTFLALNRDDDCLRWIKFWIFKSEGEDTEDWVNDTTTDRYGDPLENKQRLRISLSHLVALSVVKMRIVAAYEAHVKVAKDILPFDDLIRENIVKMSVCDDIERQKALRKKYLRMVHKHNKHMLPGLLDFDPLEEPGFTEYPSKGNMSEAGMTMNLYYRDFFRIPGAQDCINDFLKYSS